VCEYPAATEVTAMGASVRYVAGRVVSDADSERPKALDCSQGAYSAADARARAGIIIQMSVQAMKMNLRSENLLIMRDLRVGGIRIVHACCRNAKRVGKPLIIASCDYVSFTRREGSVTRKCCPSLTNSGGGDPNPAISWRMRTSPRPTVVILPI